MQKIHQAVILAGGAGTRLKPFTLTNPKPMVPINGKPFLEYLMELLKENGIKEVVILIGYLGEKIKQYFNDGSKFGIKIKYSYTPYLNDKKQENQSGLRLKNAENLLDNYFLLMYCDNYWPLQLNNLVKFFNQHPSDTLVTAFSNADNTTRSNLFIEDGYVIKYDPTRITNPLNGVDIGFFIVNKKVLKLLPDSNSKFEEEILPKLIKKKRLTGYLSNQKYYSIGNLDRVNIITKFLSPQKIIFLDRDGVINKKPKKAEYVTCWKEFKFLPGSIEAIGLLNQLGYKIFIISNQSGIARGKLTKKDLDNIHKKMTNELKKYDAKIDGIYYCPHGWNEGCECRKPKPGLLFQASYDHLLTLTKTLFVGDDKRDKQAGDAVGCKTILVSNRRNLLQIVNSLK